jgi:hypothetical protein
MALGGAAVVVGTLATAPAAFAVNTTTLAITSPATAVVGTPISASATLGGATAGATGQIGFAVFPGPCGSSGAGTPVPPPVNVAGNGVYSSATYTPSAVGSYSWGAFYSGDANNSSAGSNCATFTVTAGSTLFNPTLTTTTSATTVTVGSPITDSATLAGGSVTPPATGQIGFAVFPSSDCTNSGPGVPVGSGSPALPANVTSGNGTYSTTGAYIPTAAGNYSFAAYYNGDVNDTAALSGCEPFTVTAATGGGPAATTLTTTTSATAVSVGSPISDTATLAGATATAGGAIGFTVFPSFNCLASGPGTPVPPPTTVSGSGSYTSATFTPTVAGSYSFAAFYSGDTNNSSSSSTCEPFTVTSTPT